jgi:hypothetical protein
MWSTRLLSLATGIALVLFGIGNPRLANAQFLQTAFEFQTFQPHPFVHALGNATVAARSYPGAIGVNPATIGTEGAVRIGSNANLSQGPVYSSPWILSEIAPEIWITAPSGTVKMGRWAAGVQVKHFSLGSTEIRSAQGDILRTIDSYQQSIKLATAFDVTSRITVGGGVNLIRSHLGSTQPSSDTKVHPTVDLGVHYQTRVEQNFVTLRPALGLSLTDFGGNVSYKNQRGDSPAPTTIRGGGALQVVSRSTQFGRPEWRIGLYGALSNRLVSGEYVRENGREYFEADGPFIALIEGWGRAKGIIGPSGEPETVGPWERITKHAGLEMSVLDVFSLRLGRFHESDDLGGWQYSAIGFGLDAYYVSLDASWTLGDQRFQNFSYGRLTVRIPLSDSPRNFWPALLGNQ